MQWYLRKIVVHVIAYGTLGYRYAMTCVNIVIVFLKCTDKVVGFGLGFVAYSKIVDDEAKHYFSRMVPKEARGIGALRVAIVF
jgi:hypothetical protein